jgi:hypothetical protein
MNSTHDIQTSETENRLAAIPDPIWSQIVPRLKEAIAREYVTLPNKWGEDGDHVDWMRAALQYIDSLDRAPLPPPEKEPGWLRTNITGFMVVVAILACIFSAVLIVTAAANQTGLIDILKLLVGALIGSAAGATAGSVAQLVPRRAR